MATTSSGYAGLALQTGAALSDIVNSYFSTKMQKNALRFQSDMAALNAKAAENSAEAVLDAGNRQIAALTLRDGAIKSRQKAAMAANGIDLGEGSAAEVTASTDLMKEIDVNQWKVNAVQAASGLRIQGVNYSGQPLMASAQASGLNPTMSATSSLLGNGALVASSWVS